MAADGTVEGVFLPRSSEEFAARPPRLAPGALHVIRSIAERELRLGLRRKMVRLLFLLSCFPPVIFITILLVRLLMEQTVGMKLGWNPLLQFLQVQAGPVALVALALGTPSVARDRDEDVLFLYAIRPVLPWHYALGKLLAVALPAAALMLLPGVAIALLRLGVTADFTMQQAGVMIGKLLVASSLVAWGYAGVTVGPSAAARKSRWALLLALACFIVPDALSQLLWRDDPYPLAPQRAIEEILKSLFKTRITEHTWIGAAVLTLYGVLGFVVVDRQVKREMIP